MHEERQIPDACRPSPATIPHSPRRAACGQILPAHRPLQTHRSIVEATEKNNLWHIFVSFFRTDVYSRVGPTGLQYMSSSFRPRLCTPSKRLEPKLPSPTKANEQRAKKCSETIVTLPYNIKRSPSAVMSHHIATFACVRIRQLADIAQSSGKQGFVRFSK